MTPGDGLDVYAVSRPATALTGDLYFVRPRGRGWVLGLGDVSGHGLEAAVYMLMVQEELDRLLGAGASLVETIHELHATLGRELPRRRFVSLVLAEVDHSGELSMVNAGHCPPLLRRATGGVESLAPTGPIVAALPRSCWSVLRSRLAEGDALVLFSDGVTETLSPELEEYGASRLLATLAGTEGPEARVLVEAILEDVDRFRAHGIRLDDATVLAVRRYDRRRCRLSELPGPLRASRAISQRPGQTPMAW